LFDRPNVHLIVPTTVRDAEMVAECLIGIFAHNKASVCLVVNTGCEQAQQDGRSLWKTLSSHCPNSTGVFVPREIGYVNAVNLGWVSISGESPNDYVGVLNDDVSVDGDFVTPLVEALSSGAAQAGASIHHVGRDGFWGKGDERYTFLEGWCWLAKIETIIQTNACIEIPHGLIYDENYSPGYCEDCDLSIRIQQAVGPLQQITLPLHHLRSRTFGAEREPFWTRNRKRLVEKWQLAG